MYLFIINEGSKASSGANVIKSPGNPGPDETNCPGEGLKFASFHLAVLTRYHHVGTRQSRLVRGYIAALFHTHS
jgi:hypothetical protein